MICAGWCRAAGPSSSKSALMRRVSRTNMQARVRGARPHPSVLHANLVSLPALDCRSMGLSELGPGVWRGDKLLAEREFVALGTPVGAPWLRAEGAS